MYTSAYFQCKRRYASARSNPVDDAPDGTTGWTILSAKHDILWPYIKVEPYDTTVEDLWEQNAPVALDGYEHRNERHPWPEPRYETRLDFWASRVYFGLCSWLGVKSGFPEEDSHCDRIGFVAGDDYVEPLLDRYVF